MWVTPSTSARLAALAAAAALAVHAALAGPPKEPADDAPRIVSIQPARWDFDVDAAKTRELVIEFDRPMSNSSHSLCGGGPAFPDIVDSPRWRNARTFVAPVELVPGHRYFLSLNCAKAKNFRSAAGVSLAPTPWEFGTLPADFEPAPEQKARNKAAFAELQRAIDSNYSYRDLRVKDWKRAYKAAEPEFLAARTDLGFAGAALRLLEPCADVHLQVRVGEESFQPAWREVDTLFRRPALAAHFRIERAGLDALVGLSDDDIGYLTVGAWSDAIDVEAIEAAILQRIDCRAMVIDARPNAGGDETLARRVAAFFVEGEKVYAKHRFRTGPGPTGFGPIAERRIEGRANPKERFEGPIAVLTSRYVMSSNEAFVLMLRQAKDCTLVGQPTYGSSGNPQPVELGNGVTLVVPTWQSLRPDGKAFEGEGLAPDVLVEASADDLKERDPILEKALAILREKLGDG